MKKNISYILIAPLALLACAPVLAHHHSHEHKDASSTQLRACRDALTVKKEFKDLPMAAFSVYPGSHKHSNVNWSIAWDGEQASGTCQVGDNGHVKHVEVRHHSGGHHHKGHHDRHNQEYSHSDKGGFYYDRHIGMWRDPAGVTCHTCTPENGFPDHSHYDQTWKPHNKYERQSERQINNMLSEQDIENLNTLDK